MIWFSVGTSNRLIFRPRKWLKFSIFRIKWKLYRHDCLMNYGYVIWLVQFLCWNYQAKWWFRFFQLTDHRVLAAVRNVFAVFSACWWNPASKVSIASPRKIWMFISMWGIWMFILLYSFAIDLSRSACKTQTHSSTGHRYGLSKELL